MPKLQLELTGIPDPRAIDSTGSTRESSSGEISITRIKAIQLSLGALKKERQKIAFDASIGRLQPQAASPYQIRALRQYELLSAAIQFWEQELIQDDRQKL